MVLGDKDVSTHPDLLAFSEGLHHVLAPGSLLDIAFLGRSAAYLAFMYDRRLHDVALLLEHLVFNSAVKVSEQAILTITDDDDGDEMSTTTWDLLYEDLFATRLSEYLQGFGHPNHPHIVELLDHATITAAADDGLLRARAFLQLMSGSDLLPTNPDWKLKFYFDHVRQPTSAPANEPPMPAPLGVHACFYEATVTVNEGLRNLLHEVRQSEGGSALAFDAWIHGALLNPDDFSTV
ncbi:hypothetical protein FKP32DRAFT_1604397 [Trametes sanguinea]|nr:hypothetical protein FKP32DRAFT_1604397 [Trametes sanguinea]